MSTPPTAAEGSVAVFCLPDLGEGLTDAEIVAWLVEEGAAIEEEQPFVRVSTAKAEVEIPSPYRGVVVACHGEAGEVLPVGAPLLEVALKDGGPMPAEAAPVGREGSGPASADAPSFPPASAAWSPTATAAGGRGTDRPGHPRGPGGPDGSGEEVRGAPHPASSPEVEGTLRDGPEGDGPEGDGPWREGRSGEEQAQAARATSPARPGGPDPEVTLLVGYGSSRVPGGTTHGRRRLRPPPPRADRGRTASPVVRRLALEWGVDLGRLVGTGPGGLITRRDVEAAVGRSSGFTAVANRSNRDAEVASAPLTADTSLETTPGRRGGRAEPFDGEGSGREGSGGEVEVLRGVRRVMAERMAASHREVAAAVAMLEAEATGLLHLRRRLAERHPEIHVTTFALLAALTARCLEKMPRLNAWATPAGLARRSRVDLGVAVQTDRGLLVPVVRDAARLGIVTVVGCLADLATRARAGTLRPEELSGATFTVSNYGAFGVDAGAPMVDVPQVAILGVGRVKDRPVVRAGCVEAAPTVWLSLAFDHRYLDGGDAGGFLRLLADVVEDPALLLEEGTGALRH